MITEPSITIHRIKCALGTDLALGKISQETYDTVMRSLQLDLVRKEWEKRQTEDGFCKLLAELLRHYNAQIYIPQACMKLCFNYWPYAESERTHIDADVIATFPRQRKRLDMVDKVFNSVDEATQRKCHIDRIRPLFGAARRIDGWGKVTDKAFKEMLDEFKEYLLTLKQE